jgi:type II secretory pathway pseudopilin PulG
MFFSQKIFTGKKMKKGGFTIIELMVSIALFTATFIAISSSFISIVDAYRKIMAERVNVDNLSTAVESMVRGLKTGTNFHCGSGGNIGEAQACPGGDTYLAFEKAKGNPTDDTDQIVYRLMTGRLERSDDGGANFYPVTDVPSVITISNLKFYVVGSVGLTNGDTVQPKAVIVMSGTVGTGVKKSSTFSIQTTITQRLLDDGSGAVAGASDSTPPSDPIGFSATTFSSSQINLTWTASSDPESGVSGYRVERCQGSGCSSFSEISSPSSNSFSDTGLLPSTSYSYRVRAVNGDGLTSGYSATASAATPASSDTTAPTTPGTPVASAVTSSTLTLNWTASTDAVGVTGYRVERCLTSSCTYAQVGTPASNSFNDSGLSANTGYTYRVRATDAAGNLSSYSGTVAVTTAASGGNIAPSGTAYRWYNNTTATANTNKVAAAGLNDANLTTDVDLSGIGGDSTNMYEAGGVIWASSQTVSSVKFINGSFENGYDGVFSANLRLQFTTDGTTWTNSSWAVSPVPAYSYDSSASAGVTYTFTGTATAVRGVRVSGQVYLSSSSSYYENMREVQVF